MDYPQLYVVFSISVGLLQMFDNLLIIQSGGRLTTPNAVITAIEFGWIIVSILVLFTLRTVPWFLPLSFVLFTIAGSVYGMFLLRDVEPGDGEILPKNVEIPLWLAIVGCVFGTYFALAGYWVHHKMLH